MRRWFIGAPVLAALVACGDSSTNTSASVATTSTVPASTTSLKTVREWAAGSVPYVQTIISAFDDFQSALNARDLETAQSAAGRVADETRNFRLSLEAAGPPPPAAAVAGPAAIEAAQQLETDTRAVAACTELYDCTAAGSRGAKSFESFGRALQGLIDATKAG